jgi:zinc transporter, ZIP family
MRPRPGRAGSTSGPTASIGVEEDIHFLLKQGRRASRPFDRPRDRTGGGETVDGGAVGAAYLTAVFISNLPESISSTSGLRTGGWKKSRILWMWIAIAVISGLASLAGYGLFQHSSPGTVGFVLAFAAGAILTMLADTMMPEAHQHGGKLTGVVTTLGFAIAATIHLLD